MSDPASRAAATLGRAVAATRWSEADPDLRRRVVEVFVDGLTVMAVGSDRPAHRRLQDLHLDGAAGRSTVLGRAEPTPVPQAVFLNGTLPTVYQLDEGYRSSRGHPGIHVVPVALALAEAQGSSVDAMLSAFLAGYEVAARIGRALGGMDRAVHPHGNWGAIGAAVTAARLLGGDTEIVADAIDVAAGTAGAHDRRAAAAGAGVHHLWAARGAHDGLLAAHAAVAGLTPVPGALEDYLLPRYGLAPDVRQVLAGATDAGWAEHLVAGNYLKLWPTCGHTHTAIGAALELRDRHSFALDRLERIDVCTFRAAAALDDQRPANELAARYSVPHVVAVALLDGRLDLNSITEQRLGDPATRALAARVYMHHDPEKDVGYPRHGRPMQMTASFTDGGTEVVHKMLSPGDPEVPVGREGMRAKARILLHHRWGHLPGEAVLHAALALEHDGTLPRLSEALRSAARPLEGDI